MVRSIIKLPANFMFLKPFDSGFPYIKVWFNDQDSKPLGRR